MGTGLLVFEIVFTKSPSQHSPGFSPEFFPQNCLGGGACIPQDRGAPRTADGGCRYANPLRRPIELAVHIRIPQDSLHIFAGFGEGDGLDELLRIAVVTLSQPVSDAVGAGIVGG